MKLVKLNCPICKRDTYKLKHHLQHDHFWDDIRQVVVDLVIEKEKSKL